MPDRLQDGRQFPRSNLMGTSRDILPECHNLEVLYLRDPLATPGNIAGLNRIKTLYICETPQGPPIVNEKRLILRKDLPRLECIYVYSSDSASRKIDIMPGSRNLFECFIMGSNNLSPIMPPYGVNSALESHEEIMQMWL